MSTEISSLEIQIEASAGSAATNLDNLIGKLQGLQNNANLTKVNNNLAKLAQNLRELQLSVIGMQNLKALSDALTSLSNVQKAAGLNNVVNSLKKLPDIIEKLDRNTIDDFSVSMKALADGLEPLATQIDILGRGFEKLPQRVSKVVTAVNKMGKSTNNVSHTYNQFGARIDKFNLNLATLSINLRNVVDMFRRVWDGITNVMSEAIEWDGIQYRFGRAFGEDAEEVYNWVLRLNEVLNINKQEFMQYSSLYGSLLKGFGLEQKKVTAISVGLTELTYDIWAAFNDRYKSLEEASDAVRSAITGEIEPIRNAGISLTEASLKEYLKTIGETTVSLENMSEAQKAQVRYSAMVDAATKQGIVGTYARELNTAEGAVRMLTQQISTLAQNLGSLLIPALSAVVPWVSAFVAVITDAVMAIASFFGITIQKIDWGSAGSGLSGVADSADGVTSALGGAGAAAKELKKTVMGFDELNLLNDPKTGSGGGGGGSAGGSDWDGLKLESIWDESILAQAQTQVEELKKTLQFVLPIAGAIGVVFATWLLKDKFLDGLRLVSEAINLWRGASIVPKFQKSVKLAEVFCALPFAASLGIIVGQFVNLSNNSEKFSKGLERIGDVFETVFGVAETILGDVARTLGKLIPHDLCSDLKQIGETARDAFEQAEIGVGDLVTTLMGMALMCMPGGQIPGMMVLGFEAITLGLRTLGGVSDEEWESMKTSATEVAKTLRFDVVDSVTRVVDYFQNDFAPTVKTAFSETWGAAFENAKNAWESIRTTFSTAKTWVSENVTKPIGDYFSGMWSEITKKATDTWTTIKTKFSDIGNIVSNAFDKAWNSISGVFSWNVGDSLSSKFKEIVNGMISGVNNALWKIQTAINTLVSKLCNFTILGKQPFLSLKGVSLPQIPYLASGGAVNTGQLFVANEAGPELLGKFGNRTGVLNSEQIVEAVSRGVYDAVLSAMRQSDGKDSPIVNVYVDGKLITQSQNNRDRMYGVSTRYA